MTQIPIGVQSVSEGRCRQLSATETLESLGEFATIFVMTLKKCVQILNKILKEKKPKTFSGTWIFMNAPVAYRYIQKNVRTENDHIDWDKIISSLDRRLQKHWAGKRKRPKKFYEKQEEVDRILEKYKDKLYTFFGVIHENDRIVRNTIAVALVRIAQRGNTIAQEEALKFIKFTVDDWIDKYYPLRMWRSHDTVLQEQLTACIYRYRFTGSFFGYVYKTLEYAGRGMYTIRSLDENVLFTDQPFIDRIGFDVENGEVTVY